jgi:3-oxoacyl-[acyl-carrier protein] reductase
VTMTRLNGKTALVTGAARLGGLGHAFSKALAASGADVLIADVLDATESASVIARNSGRKVLAVRCDLTNEVEIRGLRVIAEREFGSCDIVVHNAGVYYSSRPIEEIDGAEWRRTMAINLDALCFLAQTFIPGMKRRGWGRFIGISSTTYHAGIGERTHYIASKAGMIGFIRSLAREVGDFGVTVNALAPGLVKTEESLSTTLPMDDPAGPWELIRRQQCIRKTLVPENIAAPLVFLASDDSAYITGQTLLVDAGWQRV